MQGGPEPRHGLRRRGRGLALDLVADQLEKPVAQASDEADHPRGDVDERADHPHDVEHLRQPPELPCDVALGSGLSDGDEGLDHEVRGAPVEDARPRRADRRAVVEEPDPGAGERDPRRPSVDVARAQRGEVRRRTPDRAHKRAAADHPLHRCGLDEAAEVTPRQGARHQRGAGPPLEDGILRDVERIAPEAHVREDVGAEALHALDDDGAILRADGVLEARLHLAVAVHLVGIAPVADDAMELPVARDQRPAGAHLHVQPGCPGVAALVDGQAFPGRAGDETLRPRLPPGSPGTGEIQIDSGQRLPLGGTPPAGEETPAERGQNLFVAQIVGGNGRAVSAGFRPAVAVTHGSSSGGFHASFSMPDPGPPSSIRLTPLSSRTPNISYLFTKSSTMRLASVSRASVAWA